MDHGGDSIDALRSEIQATQDKLSRLKARLSKLQSDDSDTPPVTSDDHVPSSPSSGGLLDRGLNMRVLDLSRVLAGPYCSCLLSDMGADVIKLEVPGKGDDSRQFPPFHEASGTSLYFVNLNRGKRSITLNLKTKRGKELFLKLAQTSDVIVENFSPGTMGRLGLAYEDVKKVNPAIIYASISGFGQTGPYKSRPGYDIISQAMSGLMSITGWPGQPPTRAGTAVGDVMAALFTTVGILAAFNERQVSGEGQHIDVSLVDSLFSSMGQHLQKIFVEGASPTRIGNRYEFIYPYDSFKAEDGWIIIAIANDALWKRFASAVASADSSFSFLLDDERFSSNRSRLEHHKALKGVIEEWTQTRKKDDVLAMLLDHRVPCAPIMGLDEVAHGEHVARAREMVVSQEQPDVGVVRLLGCPVKMSGTHPHPHGPAPRLGQHTVEVMSGLLGLSDVEVAQLVDEGVV